MEIASIKSRCGRVAAFVLAGALALALAPSAQAAKNWNGSSSGNWATSGNWTGTSGRRYFKKENLSGSQVDRIYLSANVTETKSTGLCFDTVPERGYWRLRSSTPSNIYTFDNSGNTGSDYDQDLICIGYAGRGSSAHFYGIKLKTRHLTVGGHASLGTNIVKYDMTGHLVLAESEINDDNNLFFGPVTITTTKTCDFFKGDLYATNANITCQSTMKLYNFTADKTGGVWTVSGDLTIAATANSTATFTNNGGDITCSGDFIFGDGAGSVGTFTLNSGTVTVPNSKWTKPLAGTGTLNLNGGTFVTQHFQDDTVGGSLTVNFNGGTLKANNAHSKGLLYHAVGNGIFVNVGANGGTIDTGAFNITVPVAINAVENTSGAFTVTGGGSATFSAMGNLAGAFTVGDNTALHWFDQDGVVSNYTFSALTIGAGSTLYLDADATGCDAFVASATNIAATATICLNFLENVLAGTQYVLFEAASIDDFVVAAVNKNTGVVVPFEKSIVDGRLVVTVVADDFTWKNTETNWGDENAWTKGGADATWSDGNNAIFATDGAAATLAANAAVNEIVFNDNATISAGGGTLTAPTVSVASGVSASIAAPTAGSLEKTGAGTLTLGSSRTAQTTLTDGTLKMVSGATVDGTKLTLGTDPAKPVTFDYAGQAIVTDPRNYLGAGMDVTLTNGEYQCTGTFDFTSDNLPATLTVARGARLNASGSARFSWNTAAGFTNTVNVAGGILRAGHGSNTHWLMQSTTDGRIDFNVTDGGLLYFGHTMCALSCRGADAPSYNNPALHFRLVDSTLQVNTGDKDFNFGYDTSNRNPVSPEGVLAATNSVVTVGRSICIGHNVVGENTAGSYTADFEDSIVTARNFYVFWDRPLNNARFNNSRFVFNAAGEVAAQDGDAKWITVDAGGLTIDNRSFNCDLKANIGGSGTVTKIGSGILRIYTNQTATAALVCEEGETYVFDGRSVMRAITVKNGAKFTTKGTGQVTLASLSLEDGAELRVDEYRSGVTPIAVTTSVTLPASGTVTLTKNNNFSQGKYRILEKAGITVADVEGKLVPATAGELTHSWSVEGDTLFLIVGNPSAFTWTGFAGDGKMSTDGNWLGNVAPGAGDPADFSSLNRNEAIASDIDATLGAVTMGEGVVTFTGSLAAASFSNTRKIVVDANATVVVAGDLTINYADGDGIVNKVDAGGRFVVDGTLTITGGSVQPVLNAGGGYIVAGGIVVNTTLYSTLDVTTQKWAIGPSGITGQNHIWCMSNKANDCWIQPYTNDFIIAVNTVVRSAIDHHELNTTGYGDNQPHTITLDGGFADNGQLYIAGTGKVVVNSVPTATGGKDAYSGNVTMTDTVTLAINAGKKLTTGKITFAAGTTLEVPSAGVEMGEIAFSGEGTVMLKVSGSELADGEYTVITSSSALATDIVNKFTLDASAVKGSKDAWLTGGGDGKSLVLNIGDRSLAASGVWVGGSGVNMSTAANWKNGQVPSANDPLDFSGVTVATTINADIDATFGAVTMGTGVVTFNGTLTATSFSDTSKVSVGANATVTFDGDLMFTGSGTKYVVYKVDAGGKFIVTGKVGLASGAAGDLQAQDNPGTGIIVAGSLVNDSAKWTYVAHDNNATTQYWAIGPGGITGTATSVGMWVYSNNKLNPEFQPNTNDFTVSLWTVLRESAKSFTYNTTGLDGLGHTITLDAGFSDKTAPLYVTGTGKVVVNHVTQSFGGKNAYSGPVTVTNSATLAINAGKKLTSGALTMNAGTTLEVAQSGDVTLDGALTCAEGTTLKFNFTTGRTAPKLVLSQTPTFGAVKVDVAGIRPSRKKNTIIEWPEGTTWPEGFDIGSVFTLADNQPKWVTGIAVEGDSLVLTSRLAGTMIVVK